MSIGNKYKPFSMGQDIGGLWMLVSFAFWHSIFQKYYTITRAQMEHFSIVNNINKM